MTRLEQRFDFSEPQAPEADLFFGEFTRSFNAVFLASFTQDQTDTATFIKWAIENGTKLPCVWRGASLFVESEPESIKQLSRIVETIQNSFGQLWQTYSVAPDVQPQDRKPFVLGLYDGMMSDDWQQGKPLPQTTQPKRAKVRARKRTLQRGPAIALHPYSIAVELGRRIRLTTPLDDLTAELQSRIASLTDATISPTEKHQTRKQK